MDKVGFKKDLVKLLEKHPEMVTCVIGYVYAEADGSLKSNGITLVPIPSRDQEDETMRDSFAKKASKLVTELTEQAYL